MLISEFRSIALLGRPPAAAFAAATLAICSALLRADDWPMWGGQPNRNMASSESGIPHEFDPGKISGVHEEVDLKTTRGVRWIAKLGSQSYGNPSIAGGRVLVGSNNETPRDPDHLGDRGIVMCFDEVTGAFLWQLVVPKLGAGKVSDWEYIGVCSSPAIEGDRAWIVTNRGETVCIDLKGMRDGNDGPFKEEGAFMVPPGKSPATVKDTHADILWAFDMRDELGVFPHNISSCSPLVVGDRVYVTTSNGVDWSHTNIPAPFAPSFVVLDKNTGELLGEEISGVSSRALHASWTSPSYGEVEGTGIVVWGGADGWCYGYEPAPVVGDEGFGILKELWRYDCNAPEYRFQDGSPLRYATYSGPSEVIATPVFYKNRAYVAIGQDPEHGDGVGRLSCIDVTLSGNISKRGALWNYTELGRSISTVSIADDLIYIAEYAGKIHCLDADTGKSFWVHDARSRIWGSTLVADGKVFIGNEDGDLIILKAGKEKQLLNSIYFDAPIYSTPVTANGTLFVASQTHLYAIDGRETRGEAGVTPDK